MRVIAELKKVFFGRHLKADGAETEYGLDVVFSSNSLLVMDKDGYCHALIPYDVIKEGMIAAENAGIAEPDDEGFHGLGTYSNDETFQSPSEEQIWEEAERLAKSSQKLTRKAIDTRHFYYEARNALLEQQNGKPPGGYASWGDYWKAY